MVYALTKKKKKKAWTFAFACRKLRVEYIQLSAKVYLPISNVILLHSLSKKQNSMFLHVVTLE